MSWTAVVETKRIAEREQGAIVKDWGGKLPIALIYPNSYYVGMSSLALHTLYHIFNARPDVVCERAFCGHRHLQSTDTPLSIETQHELSQFSVLATSFSFELDYVNFIALLRRAEIPVLALERDESYPFVLAGGPAVSANPEPLSLICDAFLIGEAEKVLPQLVDALHDGMGTPKSVLRVELARIPGVYVPDQTQEANSVLRSPPAPVQRQWVHDLNAYPTETTIYTRNTEFGDMHLLEIARGCGHACRFCLAGCLYRPVRERSAKLLLEHARLAAPHRSKVGLVSAAVSDYSQIDELLVGLDDLNLHISVSSLRVDPLSERLLAALASSGSRTLTLAPEAGSEKLRQIIHKHIHEKDILHAAKRAAAYHFPELKLYFMLGLPGEEDEDVQAIAELTQQITALYHGRVLASVAAFVPKPHTAFERQAMAPLPVLKERMHRLERSLRVLDVRLTRDSLPWSQVQAVLARGDRRLGHVLAALNGPALADWERALQEHGLHAEMFSAARDVDEPLPWSFVRVASTARDELSAYPSAMSPVH